MGSDIDSGFVSATAYRSGVPGEPSPQRPLGSARRTATIDITVEDGSERRLRLEGRARDLRRTSRGDEIIDEVAMRVLVDLAHGTVAEVAVTPKRWQHQLDALVGRPARSGFRRALVAAAPELVTSGSPLALLIDDVPVCVLISGNIHARRGGTASGGTYPSADVCAGWQVGGQLLTLADRAGGSPLVIGPHSGGLDAPDDPGGWHDVPPLGEWSMRRARRLDVVPEEVGAVRVVAYLHDVRRLTEPGPRTVHEYSVVARIDGAGVVRQIDAIPHVLPAPECPRAAASAHRLVDVDVERVRDRVTAEFTGVGTCTHLNDVLRGIGDTRRLIDTTRRG